jgi:hypothetical protein
MSAQVGALRRGLGSSRAHGPLPRVQAHSGRVLVSLMANQPRPGNPARAVRVEDELWEAALAKAEREGTTVSEVIRKALRRYVAR